MSSCAALAGVTARELSGDARASAAEAAAAAAAACGGTFEAPPSLVELPALESIALYMHGKGCVSALHSELLICLAAARNINSKQLSDGSEITHECQPRCCHQVLTIVSRGPSEYTEWSFWADTVRAYPFVITNGVGLPEWACSDASRKQVV